VLERVEEDHEQMSSYKASKKLWEFKAKDPGDRPSSRGILTFVVSTSKSIKVASIRPVHFKRLAPCDV
jgi:hypothetical protein